MKIRTGDKVQVITGKYKGVKSEVLQIFEKESKVLVKDVNVVVRHVKKQGENEGGRLKLEKPIDISKLMVVCPNCEKATRVGFSVKGGKKSRVCKKCKKAI